VAETGSPEAFDDAVREVDPELFPELFPEEAPPEAPDVVFLPIPDKVSEEAPPETPEEAPPETPEEAPEEGGVPGSRVNAPYRPDRRISELHDRIGALEALVLGQLGANYFSDFGSEIDTDLSSSLPFGVEMLNNAVVHPPKSELTILRMRSGSVYSGASLLTYDDTAVSGDVAFTLETNVEDLDDYNFFLTTAVATTPLDVWVESFTSSMTWRLRVRARVGGEAEDAFVPEWRASGNVAWGSSGVTITPIFSVGWHVATKSFDSSTVFQHHTGDIVLGGENLQMTFFTSLSGSEVTVSAGTVRIHVSGQYAMAESSVTLTGNPEWVYLRMARGGGTPAVYHAAGPTAPDSTNTHLHWPLAKYSLGTATGKYGLDYRCHIGDVNIDSPIR
jgi:hypothetical protein